ncbi:hypothetical protein E2562_003602 [Oryza meyeriana var. granulata]|uniref:Uncharacterized protein n=1 Tax=Oryza meyeriana var. granulata TaxID=110450 RepID=A0A6G1CNF6_9ORYZ|nr:hypothetical protein E2562_003602 [Oryza meyeriana var. granulata]
MGTATSGGGLGKYVSVATGLGNDGSASGVLERGGSAATALGNGGSTAERTVVTAAGCGNDGHFFTHQD